MLRRLALDAVAVEVVRALRRAGIEPVLLKGPSIVDRLYAGDGRRTYRDVDLLVAPEVAERAGRLLGDLGFREEMAGARADEHCRHSRAWARPDGRAAVDLHLSLPGVRAAPAVVWAALRSHTRPLWVGPESLRALDDVGLAMHVALHAANDGVHGDVHDGQALADLHRALATFDGATMASAAALAASVDATPAFVTGLRLVPAGRALAAALVGDVDIPPATVVRALSNTRGTQSIGQLLAEPGWRRPMAAVRLAFPSRTLLCRTTPLARRGRLGLVAAYAVRPLRMVAGLPAAVRAWRSATAAWRD